MTATLTASHPTTIGTPVRPVWRTGLGYGLVASAATTAVAGVAHAAGVSLAVSGQAIPLAGFAQLTFVAAIIGAVIAATYARRASRPRRTFVVTTLVLTALSLVPDALGEALVSTRLTLALSHVVAAAIVVPALAARLSD